MISKTDRLRARFRTNDEIIFGTRPPITGKIIRVNRTTATILSIEKDTEYRVQFHELKHLNPEQINQSDETKIERVAAMARALLDEHHLKKWQFEFDHSARRAGCCNHRDQLITVSFELARSGSEADIQETLLHEIAHALVGKNHNHDTIWKAQARAIGCSGERTHQFKLFTPRYHINCQNSCFPAQPAHRRNPRLICRTCGGKLIYSRAPLLKTES